MTQNQIQTEQATNQGNFSVRITDFGMKGLKKMVRRNQQLGHEIDMLMEKLAQNPEIGIEMTSDLYGLRTVSSEDREFRIVYSVEHSVRQVTVHAIGNRRTVYEHLARFLKRVMPYSIAGAS